MCFILYSCFWCLLSLRTPRSAFFVHTIKRRGIMMKSIVSELEALQTRCDRLTASREKRTEEVEKAMGRLREVWKP